MRSFMKSTLIAAMLLASGSVFGADISIGIRIGPPPPPYVVHVLPPSPGPEFVWVPGYWYPVKKQHYKWHEGYWTLPPYEGAEWVPPHYGGQQFFAGYWDGDDGWLEHDHHWDRDRYRDHHWCHDRYHHRGHDWDDDQGEDHDR